MIAIAPIFVPAIAGRSQRSRWSSVPNSASAGVAMSVCTDDRHRDRARATARQLLDEHDPGGEVAAASAPAGRVVEAEEAELAAAPEQRVGEVPGPLPLVDVGPHFGVDEAAHSGAELVVLGREDGVVHLGANGATRRSPP